MISQGSCQAENASFKLVSLLVLPATADFDNAEIISFFFSFFFSKPDFFSTDAACVCVWVLILQNLARISLRRWTGQRAPGWAEPASG